MRTKATNFGMASVLHIICSKNSYHSSDQPPSAIRVTDLHHKLSSVTQGEGPSHVTRPQECESSRQIQENQVSH